MLVDSDALHNVPGLLMVALRVVDEDTSGDVPSLLMSTLQGLEGFQVSLWTMSLLGTSVQKTKNGEVHAR